ETTIFLKRIYTGYLYSANGKVYSISEESYGAWMGQKNCFLGGLGHEWDIFTHMNFGDFHMK
ncbi:hypothetical protein ACS136_30340, partial [Enterobacter hormaechei subsp. steigerwaltii]